MAIQRIPAVLSCGTPYDNKLLARGIRVGDSRTPGAVKDADELIPTTRYVVSGTGTIGYNSNTYAVGASFVGVAGQTAFTRSASTALLIKTKGNAVPAAGLNVADYIVAGAAGDSIEYPSTDGNSYSPGDMFRGSVGVDFEATNNAHVYQIDDNPAITTALANHHVGSVIFPNTLDYSSALGFGASNGAAVLYNSLAKVYLWNFGTSPARVIIKAYVSERDRIQGGARSDYNFTLPANGVEYGWIPNESFRQGAEGNAWGRTEADREISTNSYVFQTSARNIWLKPESDPALGFQ